MVLVSSSMFWRSSNQLLGQTSLQQKRRKQIRYGFLLIIGQFLGFAKKLKKLVVRNLDAGFFILGAVYEFVEGNL
jgi:hypothetical protein